MRSNRYKCYSLQAIASKVTSIGSRIHLRPQEVVYEFVKNNPAFS